MRSDTPAPGTYRPQRRSVPEPSLQRRLAIQSEVIKALMIRHIMAKYGRGNLGFLWLIVEPIFLIGGLITMWSLLHPAGAHGLSVAAFVISGYVPLTLWRHLSNAVRVMSSGYGLLYHRRVTVFDIIVARSLTEIAGVGGAGLVVYFLLLSVGIVPWIEQPSLVLAGWLMMCWFAFGVSCIIIGISEKSEVLENLIQPTQYLLLPLSGAFFMVSWLPEQAQDYALMVPLVHIYELFRAGFFGPGVETHYSISYIAIWACALNAIGICTVVSSRKNLTAR